MNEAQLNKLLDLGEQAAQRGDWQASKKYFEQAVNHFPQDVLAVNGLASSLLQLGNADQAIPHFERIASLLPESADAHNNLGVAYLIAGLYPQAEKSYRKAVELSSENVQAWKNLAIVCLKQNKMEEGVQILASVVKAYPKDIEALYLLGQCYHEAEEFDSARYLYKQAAKINPDYEPVKQALSNLPVTSVDSSRIARSEHAQKLAALKNLKKNRQKHSKPPEKSASEPAVEIRETSPSLEKRQSLAFYGLPELPGGRRAELIARLLGKEGYQTKFAQGIEEGDLENFDCLVFSQPHLSPDLINGVMACIQSGKRFAVDIDQDYHNLPQDHPAYSQYGPGNANSMKALNIMLQEAEWVSVPSVELAERMSQYNKTVRVVLPVWDRENLLWEKPKQKRAQFNIGWMGNAADRPDLWMIKSILEDCLQKIPQAQLVIAGDPMAYEMFENISETRRLYLPAASTEDIPYVLSQFDIRLIPLRETLFNQAKSDLPLLEAGVLRIPWVATPIRAFREWKEGGLLADTGEWCESIIRLVNKEKQRLQLGENGRKKAESRESQRLLSA
ncbi:MAG: tetratricopeptide repeat protein [Anaerolineales bacterium]|nr:tetratricopeptide repeat protein [Anaerolineales bacterium]